MTPTSDLEFMARALRLGEHGRGRTAPNPPVGAILVAADGSVVGEGWHHGAGLAHAEVEALRVAGPRAEGATLYVTLAPCTREGRTPACLPQIIAAGIARVVIGSEDPDPNEQLGCLDDLRAAGIDVTVGVLENEARSLIAGFTKLKRTGRPAVTVKIASSLDGRVAAADGSSRWVTGPTARRDAHRLRGWSDAVMVGIGTVLADDPALTCRLRGYEGPQPLRVILDSAARLPLDAIVLDGTAPTLVAVANKAAEQQIGALRERGAEVMHFPSRDGRVDVAAVLDELGRRGIADLLVEGGPTVSGELVERRLVDKYIFYIAPKLLGQIGLSAVAGVIAPNIADARELMITSVRKMGADVKIEAKPRI